MGVAAGVGAETAGAGAVVAAVACAGVAAVVAAGATVAAGAAVAGPAVGVASSPQATMMPTNNKQRSSIAGPGRTKADTAFLPDAMR